MDEYIEFYKLGIRLPELKDPSLAQPAISVGSLFEMVKSK
jgi:hypothetical protein